MPWSRPTLACPRVLLVVVWGALAVSACKEDKAEPEAEPAAAEPVAAEPAAEPKADAAAPAEPAPPPEPPPSGHAIVKVGGLLFTSATGSDGVEVPALGEGADAPLGITVNAVGQVGDRVVVETLPPPSELHHCAGALTGLRDMRLRMYVARTDLIEVTKEEVRHEFSDGTKVVLASGVALAPSSSAGERKAHAAGVVVELPIPSDKIGLFAAPGRSQDESGELGEIYPGEVLRYGSGRTLAEDSLYVRHGHAVLHYGTREDKGDLVVTVRGRCVEVVARTDTDRLTASAPPRTAGILGVMGTGGGTIGGGAYAIKGHDDEDVWGGLTGTEIGEAYGVGGLGLVGTSRSTKTTWTVAAANKVHWADGSEAGEVLAEHTFEKEPVERGGRKCFDTPLRDEGSPALTLCFEGADVVENAATASTSLGTIGLGTYGTGSGYGRGSGAGFGGSGKRVPTVRQAKAEVKGSLDKDIIRRIVRAHINEVRYCYNQGLTKDPALKGRVAIQFTIGPTGKVPIAVLHESTLKDKDVGNCIAKAVKRWTFPKPTGGGNVIVTYPFVLEPGA